MLIELLAITSAGLALLTFGVAGSAPRIASLVLLAITTAGQIGVQGFRWQLAPIYLCSTILLAVTFTDHRLTGSTVSIAAWGSAALVAAALIAVMRFPPATVPPTTGPFAVGTSVMHLVDAGRAETLAANYHGPRELMIEFWYPTVRPSAKRSGSSGWTHRLRRVLAGDKLASSLVEAPLAPSRALYRVIIFSPSWRGQRDQNLFQLEELASHGYVVVGIDHPYVSRTTVFPDGRVVYASSAPFWDLSSAASTQRSFAEIERELSVRVADIKFVATSLARLAHAEGQGRWNGRIATDSFGILGYSFGGAAAAQVCRDDPRCAAGINMDGSLFGTVADAGVPRPFLFIDEKTQQPSASELTQANGEKRRFAQMVARDARERANSIEKYGGYRIVISGTDHANFTDPPEDQSLRYDLFDIGRINPERALRIINAYTLAFFNHYLKGMPATLLQGKLHPFPEVEVTYRPPPSGRASEQLIQPRIVTSSTALP
jgi:predicted dienelactone hydrolase